MIINPPTSSSCTVLYTYTGLRSFCATSHIHFLVSPLPSPPHLPTTPLYPTLSPFPLHCDLPHAHKRGSQMMQAVGGTGAWVTFYDHDSTAQCVLHNLPLKYTPYTNKISKANIFLRKYYLI